MRRLSDLNPGDGGLVRRVVAPASLLRRLYALGLRPGLAIRLVRRAPLGGPLEVQAGESLLALRHSEAQKVYLEVE